MFSSGVGGGGAKEECVKEIFTGGGGGGRACLWISIQFLLSDGECYYNDKTIDFFHIFSDVAIGSENSTSLN